MNLRFVLLAGLAFLLVVFVGCSFSPAPRSGYAPLEVNVEPGSVRMLRRGMTVCLIRTELPRVEKWEIINRNTEIVVKSREERGPAVVQLFDTQTGILKGKVLAYTIHDGQPEWAQGFED